MVRGGPERRPLALTAVAAAYSATGAAWQAGPVRVYDRLAEVLVARSPVPLSGAVTLDVGAGTGAAGRAARTAGAARVVAVDASPGMLAANPARLPATAGDICALPFATGAFDAAVAAFVLNHLTDPAAGLAEMRRVTRPGGAVLAAVYASDDAHPVKAAVEDALAARGWVPDAWYVQLHEGVLPILGTVDGCASAMREAGLQPGVVNVQVPMAGMDAPAMVEWRTGLAQHAAFFASLPAPDRRELVEEVVARLGDPPEPLVRSILVMAAVSPGR